MPESRSNAMNPRQKLRSSFAAIMIAAIAGTASASSGPIPLGDVIEWVEISIHMPDGRVIKTTEPKYPSRSRVHITTGMLPPFKRSSDASASGSDLEMQVELVEDPSDLIEELSPEDVESGGAVDVATELESFDEPTTVDESSEESSGAVRQFKKSS